MSRVKQAISVLLIVSIMIASLCSCSSKTLSNVIIGEWSGQFDVAKLFYKELADELDLGVDVTPEPAYCTATLRFDSDNSFGLQIDINEFTEAVGKCTEPFTSFLFGVDTEWIVSLLMQYIALNTDDESGFISGTYEVNDDERTITLYTNGAQDDLYWNDDGMLEFRDKFIGQEVAFKKKK